MATRYANGPHESYKLMQVCCMMAVVEAIDNLAEVLSESHRVKFENGSSPSDNDLIEDGFGSKWSAWCSECKQKTMQVVRPGKAQCTNCG